LKRVHGLDSIRFVCAIWVVINHFNLPPIFGPSPHGILHLVNSVYRGLVNGQAAVMVFFVISGFCIHYPFRNGGKPHLPSFYTRRLLRIGIPLLCSIPISNAIGIHYTLMNTSILWSLICEMIYYILYPGLLVLQRKYGWKPLLALAYVLAYAVVATKPGADKYDSYGDLLNWIVGLPVWLLGCMLAQKVDRLPDHNAHNIWLYRVAVILAGSLAIVLRWNLHRVSIGFPWTLNLFALLVYVWLPQEIIYFRLHQPLGWLEAAGAWSYSLYLMHLPGGFFAMHLGVYQQLNPIARNLMLHSFALLFGYTFYRLVERPSHQLAIKLGNLAKRIGGPMEVLK
jgi:peptidoglycan/LPS O-acetylase OafA/YrhL